MQVFHKWQANGFSYPVPRLEDETKARKELEKDVEDLKKTSEETRLNCEQTQKEIDLVKEELDRLKKEHKDVRPKMIEKQ